MRQSKSSLPGPVILLLSAFGLLIALLLFRRGKTTSTSGPRQLIVSKLETAGYSPDFARMWGAVAAFETGNFTSSLYVNHHNLFGMAWPTVGVDYGHTESSEGTKSSYETDAQSIDDLIEYLQAKGYPQHVDRVEDLVHFMKSKSYFGSPEAVYLAGVKRYL